jgi:hypothetical protein
VTGAVAELAPLRERLGALLRSGGLELREEGAFRAVALEVFRAQCRWNPVYGAFVRGRGIDPEAVSDWRDIPPVPASAFRELPLITGDPEAVRLVFRTSGTTRGRAARGVHRVVDPGLYRDSLLPTFREYLLPDGARLPLISLVPSPEHVPDSSLSFMMGCVAEELTAAGGDWVAGPTGALDEERLDALLREAERAATPVLLAGTAFAWVHWLDAMERRGLTVRLPTGSRIMETGGFKGRSREVPRPELYALLTGRLGIPADHIVNEYGMTELLSQFYEPVLREGCPGVGARRHVGPSWVRTRILHPETLRELPDGEPGLLAHLDLANLYSVSALLTEDLGVRDRDGFRVLGRAPGAEPRGCSLVMEELLSLPGADG